MAGVVTGFSLTHLLFLCLLQTLLPVCLFHQVQSSSLPRLTSTISTTGFLCPSGCGPTSRFLLSLLLPSASLALIIFSIPAVALFPWVGPTLSTLLILRTRQDENQ